MAAQPVRNVPVRTINSTLSNLQVAGPISGTICGDWTTHTQSLQGTFVREWNYDCDNPSWSDGVFSGCPPILNNCVTIVICANTTTTLEQNVCYSPSSWAAPHEVEYLGTAASGGYGVSGTFFTTQLGLMRKLTQPGDTSGICDVCVSATVNCQPGGIYNNFFDTSSNVNSDFFTQIIPQITQECPTFNPLIVSL